MGLSIPSSHDATVRVGENRYASWEETIIMFAQEYIENVDRLRLKTPLALPKEVMA